MATITTVIDRCNTRQAPTTATPVVVPHLRSRTDRDCPRRSTNRIGLPWTLGELGRYLGQWGVDYRVLVADDGSTDLTPTLTNTLGPRFSHRFARSASRQGLGLAHRHASGDGSSCRVHRRRFAL